LIVANQAGAPSSWYLVWIRSGSMAATFHPLLGRFAAFRRLNRLLDGKICKPKNLRKEWDKDKLASVCFACVVSGPKDKAVLSANREDHQSGCHWVIPSVLRKADRESDYTAPISEATDGSLMAVGGK
jgi:hypothetical protein